jgi:DNA-binding response OmpR family regulator
MKKRILICDDDADTREVISLIITKHGYEVEHAENGRLLIERAITFKPDLIFLDIMMPDIAGKEARRLLKELPETTNIPVLILSALNNGEQIASEIGAEGYVAKPFDMKVLLEKVRSMLF